MSPNEPIEYLDFDIEVTKQNGVYNAHVLNSPSGEASQKFELPFSKDRIELLKLKLSGIKVRKRHLKFSEGEKAARELGAGLFNAVFSDEIRACLRGSINLAQAQQERDHKKTGIRIKLRLENAPELTDIPWEFILDTHCNRFFAQSQQTPIVRYIELPETQPPLVINLPLKILAIISSPCDYPQLNIEQEKECLNKAFENLIRKKRIEVSWLEQPSCADLQSVLNNDQFHVIHYIGHGGFDETTEKSVLVFMDESKKGVLVGAQQISVLFHDHPTLRLVVLNSCEGATNTPEDPFASLATSLIRQGIPAVVTMQFEISDKAAVIFADSFYKSIAIGFPVDAAVSEARKAIFMMPNEIEWGTPVLYMRTKNGVLFTCKDNNKGDEQPPQNEKAILTVGIVKQKKIANLKISPISFLKDHKIGVKCLNFSPNGNYIATSGGNFLSWYNHTIVDSAIRIWKIPEGTISRKIEVYDGLINEMQFSNDSTKIAAVSIYLANTLKIYLYAFAKGFSENKFNPTTFYSTLRVFDMKGNIIFQRRFQDILFGSISPNFKYYTFFSESLSQINIWAHFGKDRFQYSNSNWSDCRSIAYSYDNTFVALRFLKYIVIFNIIEKQLHAEIEIGSCTKNWDIRFFNRWVNYLAIMEYNSISIWKLENILDKKVINIRKSASCIAFSPDNQFIAAGVGNEIEIWDIETGELANTLTSHKDIVTCLDYNHDGSLLAEWLERYYNNTLEDSK